MKAGLNRQEQFKVTKYLEAGVDPIALAKKFNTTPEIIKEFTPEKVEAWKDYNKKVEERSKLIDRQRREKAAVLKVALTESAKDEGGPAFN
jgi:hypothetical protein